MATIAFSGSLQPKKKAELQEIATALNISGQGTKEDLQLRIKDHLEANTKLEEEPAFAGLFNRVKRRRTEKAHHESHVHHDIHGRFAADDSASVELSPSRSSRRGAANHVVHSPTPEEEEESGRISSMLKNRFGFGTPSMNLGAMVPSPSKSIREFIPSPNAVMSVVKKREEMVIQQGGDMLLSLRQFLSNSRNIWSFTALFELMYILYAVIPWDTYYVPLSTTTYSSKSVDYKVIGLKYAPLVTFTNSAFWITIGHWAIATLFIPALFGTLISFRPAPQRSRTSPHAPNLPFDALTASIVRLAAQVIYPYTALEAQIQGIDVLGWRWRVVGASVGVAFAFAEAISGALIPRSVIVEDEDGELTQLQIEG